MPLPSYTFIHRNAKLTTVQKEENNQWIDQNDSSIKNYMVEKLISFTPGWSCCFGVWWGQQNKMRFLICQRIK
jgi:hypothetical protein